MLATQGNAVSGDTVYKETHAGFVSCVPSRGVRANLKGDAAWGHAAYKKSSARAVRSADILVCGFWRLSSRQLRTIETRDWKVP